MGKDTKVSSQQGFTWTELGFFYITLASEIELTHTDHLHSGWNIQHRSAIVSKSCSLKELPVSLCLFNLHFVIHRHDLSGSRSPSSSMWRRAPMRLWMTHGFIAFPFANQHSRPGEGISSWKATLRGKWYAEHITQTCITHSHILLLPEFRRSNRTCSRADLWLSTS